MSEFVKVGGTPSLLEIIIDRPAKKNAITAEMYAAMADALARAEDDDAVRSVVLLAEGDTFSAGNDLQDFFANPPTDGDSPVMQFLGALAGCSKVVVAAIQGNAVGVGATMLLHCDHVVAAEDASLQFAFVKMALVPEAASSLLLPRIVGPLKAAELMLTGDPVAAREAERIGLVSRVVPLGDQQGAARAFAGRTEGLAPTALRQTKRLLRSATTGVAERMAEEGALFSAQLSSPEFMEAVAAFMQKREPDYAKAAATG